MSKPRILFADDSVTIQQVFEFAFENEDIEVILASDGQEAFDKTKELKPDMVIADVNMPDVDGFELCTLIKDEPSISSTPVYLLSSSLEEFDDGRAQTARADGNFNKPFKSEEILEKVRKVIAEIPEPAIAVSDENISDKIADLTQPAMAIKDEYTFDEIDVSIDNILDGIEATVKTDAALDPRLEGIESAMEEALTSSHMLDLGAEAMVEVEPGSDEELAVEVISEEVITEEELLEAKVSLDAGYAEMAKLDEELGELSSPEASATGDSEPDEAPVTGEDDPVASAPGDEALKAEDDPATGAEQTDDDQIADNMEATTGQEPDAVGSEEIGDLEGEGITESINEAIREAVADKLKSGEMETLLANMVQTAMDEMKPQMQEMLKQVAQNMTLDVAEEMVKKTIDQIKNEK